MGVPPDRLTWKVADCPSLTREESASTVALIGSSSRTATVNDTASVVVESGRVADSSVSVKVRSGSFSVSPIVCSVIAVCSLALKPSFGSPLKVRFPCFCT